MTTVAETRMTIHAIVSRRREGGSAGGVEKLSGGTGGGTGVMPPCVRRNSKNGKGGGGLMSADCRLRNRRQQFRRVRFSGRGSARIRVDSSGEMRPHSFPLP